LRLDALPGIHDQNGTFAGRQGTADFIGKVDVPRGVDEVQLVGLAVLRRVMQGHTVRLDGNSALTFQIHGVEDLRFHLAIGQATADLDETISQCRLAMVDVGNDGKITDMAQVAHGNTLEKDCRLGQIVENLEQAGLPGGR